MQTRIYRLVSGSFDVPLRRKHDFPMDEDDCAPLTLIRIKQEGAELCQAQPAKHKVFGSNGAILFWFELLMVELLNC